LKELAETMAKPYASEMVRLAETFAWAATADIGDAQKLSLHV